MQVHKKKPFEGKKLSLLIKRNACIKVYALKNKNLYNLQVQVDFYLGAIWYIFCDYIYMKNLSCVRGKIIAYCE